MSDLHALPNDNDCYRAIVQEDYVKWKGALFFRFVSTLVDADPDIQRFGAYNTVAFN
jgi:hypothetical protein